MPCFFSDGFWRLGFSWRPFDGSLCGFGFGLDCLDCLPMVTSYSGLGLSQVRSMVVMASMWWGHRITVLMSGGVAARYMVR